MNTSADPKRPPPTVFLSYASQDRQAAQAIRDALPELGLEVWYDESDLNGGDAWDQKIRRQIRECDFFMPVISASTEARAEGYFRREWRLAVERALDMADDHTFLLPVVIDETSQAGARVPEKFLGIQWLKLPAGQPTAAFEAMCRRLVSGETVAPPAAKKTPGPATARRQTPPAQYPPFPREEPGQKTRFFAHVIGWAFQSAWIFFNRLPKWLRVCLYVWLAIAVLTKGCSHYDDDEPTKIPATHAAKIKAIADSYSNSSSAADLAKLGAQIAHEYAKETEGDEPAQSAVLAIPFSVPAGDPAARKLTDATFAQMYGKLAISHHGHVALLDEPLSSADPAAAAEQGRTHQSKYVVFGSVDEASAPPSLALKIVSVADASVVWSDSQPVAGADPAKLAAEVDTKMQSLEAD